MDKLGVVYPYNGLPWGYVVKNSTTNAADLGRSPEGGNGNPLSNLAWEIPWTEKPGRQQSMGLQSWTQLSKETTSIQWNTIQLQKA